jgi:hypothetical protein
MLIDGVLLIDIDGVTDIEIDGVTDTLGVLLIEIDGVGDGDGQAVNTCDATPSGLICRKFPDPP